MLNTEQWNHVSLNAHATEEWLDVGACTNILQSAIKLWVPTHKASWMLRPFRCQGAWETLFHVTWMNVKMFVDYGGSRPRARGPV